MTITSNPLLNISDLPAFTIISSEQVVPAMRELLQQSERALGTVIAEDFPADWHAIAKNLDVVTERLSRAWGVVGHLVSVKDSKDLRAAYNEALPLVTDFWTRLGASMPLYSKFKSIQTDDLDAEERRALHLSLRDFVLSGAELEDEKAKEFAAIQEKLAALQQKYSENVLDATDAYRYYASAQEVDGIPADVLQAAQLAAKEDGQNDSYKLTLKMPVYLPVMQYANNRALRKRLFYANATRASDLAPIEQKHLDNSVLIEEILQLRQREAELLGFQNYAELSLATKMASSPTQVIEFLRDLASRARSFALQDVEQLRAFAKQTVNLEDPQPWDWTWLSEKLKQQKFSFSDQEVKAYFPIPNVLNGLFGLVEKLFNINIKSDKAPVWDVNVSFYRIEREGRLIGQFYLDQAARLGKRGGAWMDSMRSRWLRPDSQTLQTPVAYLVCNFAAASQGKPALLTHDDVITLFHEFGHGLHHMLTQVSQRDISGINGVEWDAVELPSQFMENFCWEWAVLQGLTSHVETGQPLPRELYEKMLAAKNFQSGLMTLRQVEFALFDMLMHTQQKPQVLELMRKVHAEVAVIPAAEFNRMPHCFSHVFAGGYAAGYFSYKWAEVLSADAYAAFEEERLQDGGFAPETGQRFLRSILEKGASRPAADSFKEFRGREPKLDALLRHQGMQECS